MMQKPLIIQAREGVVVAKVVPTQLNYQLLDLLQREVSYAAQQQFAKPVILDLTNVETLPSLVMGALVDILNKLQQQGNRLVLVGMNKHARNSFSVTRIDLLFEIYESVEHALVELKKPAWR